MAQSLSVCLVFSAKGYSMHLGSWLIPQGLHPCLHSVHVLLNSGFEDSDEHAEMMVMMLMSVMMKKKMMNKIK